MTLRIQSPAEQVYSQLRKQIVRGDLPPGGTLALNDICGLFGISRSVLRLICVRLEQDGLLEFKSRCLRVPPLLAHEIDEVLALRLHIEPAAAARAARSATAIDCAIAEAHFRSLEYDQINHREDFLFLQRQFNLSLIPSKNTPLTGIFAERLHMLSDRHLAPRITPEFEKAAVSKAQLKLLAWTSGNWSRVAELIRDDILTLRTLIENQAPKTLS